MTDELHDVLTETVKPVGHTATIESAAQKADSDAAAAAWDRMQSLYESKSAFDVTITDVVKGGLVADVGIRAFIPASLVDRKFVGDLNELKGQSLTVQVSEVNREANRLILSRKAVLESEQTEKVKTVLSAIHEGDVLEGTVQRLTNFGAFVDIGGVDGLVHVSELSHSHVAHPSDAVAPGDKVKVKVLRVDPEMGKVSLSVKEAAPGPWEQHSGELKEDSIVTGIVKRIVDFGAFIELFPGLEGLVHISQLSTERVGKVSDVLGLGQQVQAKVLAVDSDRKRVSLSIKDVIATNERKEMKKYIEKQPEATSGTGATLGDLFGDLFKNQK